MRRIGLGLTDLSDGYQGKADVSRIGNERTDVDNGVEAMADVSWRG